jgi:predicted porin
MQKKLLAVAVAGALASPAAFAQSSVTIYGTLSFSLETRSATGGDSATAAAALTASPTGVSSVRNGGANGPNSGFVSSGNNAADLAGRTTTQGAGSNFGIRVREDLGGSMYAWAQLELSVQGVGYTPISSGSSGKYPSYRNSALALGSSAWGDVMIGTWDSPLNVNANPAPQHAAYGNASTSFSSQLLLGNPMAPATISSSDVVDACIGGGAITTFQSTAQTCLGYGMSFHRRVPNSVQYWSPSWSGFQVKVMYGAEQQKQAQSVTNTIGVASAIAVQPSVLDPRLWGGSLTYSAGPLYVGVGYEKHKDMLALATRTWAATAGAAMTLGGTTGLTAAGFSAGTTGVSGSDDTAWNLNARYTFGAFTVGAYYDNQKWTVNYANAVAGDVLELRRKAWGVEGAWVAGPHTVGLRFAKANKLTGTLGGTNTFNGDTTGSRGIILGYGYSLSKRTSVFGYFTQITNETNARYTGIVFNGLNPAAGADPKYMGLGIRHTF